MRTKKSSAPIKAAICACSTIHGNIVRAVKAALPDNNSLRELADFFHIFGDGTRLSILWALSESELCVCDLCALLGIKQSAASHQLASLRQSRTVKYRREGKIVYYSLHDDHIRKILDAGMKHIQEPSGKGRI